MLQAAQTQKQVETPLFDISRMNLSQTERAVLSVLDSQPLHTEEIIASADLRAERFTRPNQSAIERVD